MYTQVVGKERVEIGGALGVLLGVPGAAREREIPHDAPNSREILKNRQTDGLARKIIRSAKSQENANETVH